MKKRKGSALSTVLITLMVVSMLMSIIYTYYMVNIKLAIKQQHNQRAYYCALGGIELGTAILNQKVTVARTPEPPPGNTDATEQLSLYELYQEYRPGPPIVNVRVRNITDVGYNPTNVPATAPAISHFYSTVAPAQLINNQGYLTIPNALHTDPIYYHEGTDRLGEVSIIMYLDTHPVDGKYWIRLAAVGIAYDANGDEVARRIERKSFSLDSSSENHIGNW